MAETLQLIITADSKEALKAVEDLAKSTEGLKTKFSTLGSSSAQANQALINSGRVLQDLNYGFMGVANNLNPLLESFQRLGERAKDTGTTVKKELISALTGPAGIGVALSAVTFIFLKFGDEISDFFTKLITGNDVLKSQKESLAGVGEEFKSAVEKVDKVSIAFQEYHSRIITGNEALKIYNTELGKNFGVKSNINDAENTFKEKTAAYVEASFQRALADSASKKAAEELLKLRLLQAQGPKVTVQDFLSVLSPAGIVDPNKTANVNAIGRYKKDVSDLEILVSQFRKIALDAQSAADLFAKGFDLTLAPEKVKKQKVEKEFDYVTAIKKRSVLSGEDLEAVKEETTIKDMEKSHQEHMNWLSKFYKFKIELARKSGEENKKVLEDQKEAYESFAKQLSGSVVNALQGVYDAMQHGESFGQAFLDMLAKITEQLVAMVVQTLIFQAIMAALTGGTSVAATGAGVAASNVAGSAGRILMVKKYAEGGIVNKPHLGLVGEAGPEAIIPLSKLSGFLQTTFNAGAMSGGGMGGNGQFVLKGNDLVLALQRSNYSLNLRRGI